MKATPQEIVDALMRDGYTKEQAIRYCERIGWQSYLIAAEIIKQTK